MVDTPSLIVAGIAILLAIIALALAGYGLTKSGSATVGPPGPPGPPGPAGSGGTPGTPGTGGTASGGGAVCQNSVIPSCVELGRLKNLSQTLTGVEVGSGEADSKIKFNGKTLMGIGTDNPKVPLQVRGNRNYKTGNVGVESGCPSWGQNGNAGDCQGWGFVDNTGSNTLGSIQPDNFSILATSYIGAEGFSANSDQRAKTSIQDIDNSIEIINKLTPKKYKFVNNKNYSYGLIAQEVKEIVPEAIRYQTEFIPNINRKIDFIRLDDKKISMNLKNFDLNLNDKIKLIDNRFYELEGIIQSINDNQYIIQLSTPIEQKDSSIFVYGKEVNDYHVLDYNYLFTLNLDVTKKLQKKIKELESKLESKQ